MPLGHTYASVTDLIGLLGPHLQIQQLLCKGLWYGIRLLLHPGSAFMLQDERVRDVWQTPLGCLSSRLQLCLPVYAAL